MEDIEELKKELAEQTRSLRNVSISCNTSRQISTISAGGVQRKRT